jgi:cell fate (sporulation/competence/biofilm development) regulator YlbF (YheA/YmcA/DUF963 family)
LGRNPAKKGEILYQSGFLKCWEGDGMSVYDKAYELARALAASPEYKEYLSCRDKLLQDQRNFSILEDFRRQQWELQMAQILGQEVEEEVAEELDQIYALLSANPIINEFLTAEYRLSKMMSEIQRIVGEAVGAWMGDEIRNRNVN